MKTGIGELFFDYVLTPLIIAVLWSSYTLRNLLRKVGM